MERDLQSYVKSLRQYEFEQIKPMFKPGQVVLEVGAGAGWQSKWIAETGAKIVSLELANTVHRPEHTIISYNGSSIPLKANSVDMVFSSNVMEHIPHVVEFQKELHRVLKPDGVAIHLMPTTVWRFYSYFTHYAFALRAVLRGFQRRSNGKPAAANPEVETSTPYDLDRLNRRSIFWKARRLLPTSHGHVGNFLQEFYLFNQFRWKKLFQDTGWRVEAIQPNGIFYTGFMLFGPDLSIEQRHQLSRVLGNGCMIYVLSQSSEKGRAE